MHKRLATNRVLALLKQFPCLTILGARQLGKSTLAKLAFPSFMHIDLENPVEYSRIRNDLPYFLKNHPKLVIDEAQYLPELFPALRSHIEQSNSRLYC